MTAADATAADAGGRRLTPPWGRRQVTLLVVLTAFFALAVVSLWQIVDLDQLPDDSAALFGLFDRMVPPTFRDLSRTLWKVVETFGIAVLGTALAAGLSVPLAFLAAGNTTPFKPLRALARGIIVASRTIPDLIMAIVFVGALSLGNLPGVLAIGFHAIGMLGKLYADAIEELRPGPLEAIAATGATRLQVMLQGVVPQVVPAFISVTLYRLDINTRAATILGLVGGGGIGLLIREAQGNLDYPRLIGITLFVLVLIMLVEWLSTRMRRILVGEEVDDAVGKPSFSVMAGVGHATRLVTDRGVRALQAGRDQPAGRVAADLAASEATVAAAHAGGFDPDTVLEPWTRQRRRRLGYWMLLAALLVAAFPVVGVNPLDFVTELFTIVGFVWSRFVVEFFTKDGWSLLWPIEFDSISSLHAAMLETIFIAMGATAIGIVLAVPAAFLAAHNTAPNAAVANFFRYFLVVERAVPELILAIIFIVILGLGPFAGMLALTGFTFGFVAKLIADAIEQVDPGPRDAVLATGASRFQERIAAVFPQIVPNLVGNTLYTLDINIRSATVLGIVGAGGVGFVLLQYARLRQFWAVTAVLLAVFLVVYPLERLSNWVRDQLI